MAALVPIPWQPHLYLTPRTLSYLTAASRRIGRNLYLFDRDYKRISPAWRSFAQQLAAWTRGLAGKGPKASSPYTGQRNHMRGAAFDLRESSAAVQSACRAVGLIRDAAEPWHWNDPLWRSMPIIKTNTASAGTGSALLPERTDVSTLYKDKAKARYALGGDSPGTSANWLITTSPSVATGWAKAHGNAIVLETASFDGYGVKYLEPVKTTSV